MTTTARSARFTVAKNTMRGALANKDGKPLEALSSSIASLEPEELPRYTAWLRGYPSRRTRLYPPPLIKEYKDLWPGDFVTLNEFGIALRWVSELVAQHHRIIDDFLTRVDAYETASFKGAYDRALTILDDIDEHVGLSIWSVEAHIGLLHRFKGLEAQKSYVRSIHEAAPRTLGAFVAFHVSQRNEDGTSLRRFSIRSKNDVDRQPVGDALKTYLVNRFLGSDSSEAFDEQEFCALLCAGSCASVIDAYDTLIDVLWDASFRGGFAEFSGEILKTLARFSPPDWRWKKLRAVWGNDFSTVEHRDLRPDDAFLRADYAQAAALAAEQAQQVPADLDALCVAATACAYGAIDPSSLTLSPLQLELVELLKTLALTRESASKPGSDLEKLALNCRTLRTAKAASGFHAVLSLDAISLQRTKYTSVFAASPKLNVRHWAVLPSCSAEHLFTNDSTPYLAVTVAKQQFRREAIQGEGLNPSVACELSILSALYHADFRQALYCARCLSHSDLTSYRNLSTKIELHCLLRTDRRDEALMQAARLYCSSQIPSGTIPLRALLHGRRWRNLRHLCSELALPILLNLYCDNIDESEHETTRRNAYDEFLKSHGCRRPSDLGSVAHQFNTNELVYFLARVCVPEVMDVSFDVFPGSKELEDERITICGLLSELDPDSSSIYRDELAMRTKYRTIQDGLRAVDQSRVHVNAEAIGRWAERELQESFSRYKTLLQSKVGVGSPEDFERTAKALLDPETQSGANLLDYPDWEGDSLLLQMLESLKEEYLTDTDYGLDAYLSMRIRHGSLSGHLRGPLEERNLIVFKNDSGDGYCKNVSLAQQLGLGTEHYDAFFAAFSAFSGRYDGIISDLTKNRLQIRSARKPQGFFALDLRATPVVLHFVRARTDEHTSFNDFLVTALTAITIPLRSILLGVSDYIKTIVKQDVEAAFESLRASLASSMPHRTYLELSSSIADVTPEILAAIDRVAGWFVPASDQQQGVLRTIEEVVEIGIEATKRAHRGFSPVVETNVPHIGIRSTGFLTEVHDILFTVLDNVYSHSGNKVSPWTRVTVSSSRIENTEPEQYIITFRIDSEAAPGVATEATRSKLERIREMMRSGEYRKQVNLEGGTGLLKLKRLVAADERQHLAFGFEGDTSFFVEISLIRAGVRTSGAPS